MHADAGPVAPRFADAQRLVNPASPAASLISSIITIDKPFSVSYSACMDRFAQCTATNFLRLVFALAFGGYLWRVADAVLSPGVYAFDRLAVVLIAGSLYAVGGIWRTRIQPQR